MCIYQTLYFFVFASNLLFLLQYHIYFYIIHTHILYFKIDIYKIYYWLIQLFFSLVFNNLNIYPYQSIFHNYEPNAFSLNQISLSKFIAIYYFSLLHKELFLSFSHILAKISAFSFILFIQLHLIYYSHWQSFIHKYYINFQTLRKNQL